MMDPRPISAPVLNGQLADCPDTPNCVCTCGSRPNQTLPPIQFVGSPSEIIGRTAEILEKMPRVHLVERKANYLHAVFASLFFRFKDDIEFYADERTNLLHFRAAARSGYYDFGVNRRRMERLTRKLSSPA